MTISVALCTYNGAAWLDPFLDSVLAQSRPPDEVVVSDDGSADATLEKLHAFAAAAPFPVAISTTPERLGSTMNFEHVFARCEGTLIAPADQDDVWAPEKLARLEAVADDADAGVVFSDGRVIDGDGLLTDRTLWEGVGFARAEQRQFDRLPLEVLLRRSVVTGAAMLFHRRLLELAVPFPAVLGDALAPMLQDRWVSLLAAAVGPIERVSEPLIDFREHADQQTGLRTPLTVGEARRQLGRRDAAPVQRVRAAQLAIAAERIEAGGGSGTALEVVRDCVAHLERRAGLPASRLARAPTVLREGFTERYWRFSGGLSSAVADLLRPRPE